MQLFTTKPLITIYIYIYPNILYVGAVEVWIEYLQYWPTIVSTCNNNIVIDLTLSMT